MSTHGLVHSSFVLGGANALLHRPWLRYCPTAFDCALQNHQNHQNLKIQNVFVKREHYHIDSKKQQGIK